MNSQRKLAAALGIAPSTLTAWKSRGCPVDQGLEAVHAWRLRHTRPDARTAPRRTLQRDDADRLVAAAEGAGLQALQALDAGRHAIVELQALRHALRAVPPAARPRVRLAMQVWDRLADQLVGALGPAPAGSDKVDVDDGAAAYAVAAGEVEVVIGGGRHG